MKIYRASLGFVNFAPNFLIPVALWRLKANLENWLERAVRWRQKDAQQNSPKMTECGIKAGARSSPLSRAQFEEIQKELKKIQPHVVLEAVWAQSPGDRDKETSLRSLGKCDFFTRDLDLMLLEKKIRIAIHSAKDLPDPIPDGLSVVALTSGVDPRDSLVFRDGETLQTLKSGSRIATSSKRREEAVRTLRSDLVFSDLRGTIGERLTQLDQGEIDGVVIAEAALIRLKLTHLNRLFLPGETALLQGKLAIVARADDLEMKQMFHELNA